MKHTRRSSRSLSVSRKRLLQVAITTVTTSALVALGSTTAVAAGLPTGPTTTMVTGIRPNATRLTFGLSDRFRATVDVATGNLNLSANLLDLIGVGGGEPIGLSYNSLDVTGGSGAPSAMDAQQWTWSLDGAGSLALQSNGSTVDFIAGDGAVWPFAYNSSTNSYSAPSGLNATLQKTANGYALIYPTSSATVAFNAAGQAQSVTDRNGNQTTIAFPSATSGTVVSPAGPARTAAFAYASGGSGYPDTTTVSQSNGSSTRSFSVSKNDATQQLSSIKDATGKTTTFSYNSAGLLCKVINADGAETDFTYDSSGRVTEVDQRNTTSGSAGTSTTRLLYASSTETDLARPGTSLSSGVSSVPHIIYTIGTNYLVKQAQDELGRVRSATYNGNLATLSSTSGSGSSALTTQNTYGANAGFSLTSTQAAGGATQSASYANTSSSSQYSPSSTTDDAGNQTTYTYDGNGNQVSSQTAAVAASAIVVRNSDGTIKTAQAPGNPSSNVTHYTYNANGDHQLVGVTPVTGSSLGSKSYSYDAFGRLSSETDGAGNTTSYTYDNDDRLLTTSFSDATPTVTDTWDAAGNLTKQVSGSGTITNGFDQLNQLISTQNSAGGGVEAYAYNAAGEQISVTDTRGTTTEAYDASGVLTSTVYPKGSGTQATNFTTDAQGRRTDTYLQANSTDTVWAAWIHQAYSTTNGRVSHITAEEGPASSATTEMSVYYCYNTGGSGTNCSTNSSGERSKLQWTYNALTNQTTTFAYDGSGRLTDMTETGGNAGNDHYRYTYDANGDRTSATVSGTDSSSQTLTYNAADQITSSGYAYDGAGNLTASPGATYTYNAAEQMTSATVGSTTTSYTYAGAAENAVLSESSSGHTYNLVYGKADPQGNPEIEQFQVGSLTAYVEPDPTTGQANMLHTSSDIACAYIYDGIGNPVGLITDFNTTAYTLSYDPYGVQSVQSNDGGNGYKQNPYSFHSGIQDRATGFVKFGARWYNPTTGSWTQRDTMDSPLDETNANRYAYAGDDPINNIDPDGRISADVLEAAEQIYELVDDAHSITEFIDDLTSPDSLDALTGLASDLLTDELCDALAGFLAPETAGASLIATIGCSILGTVVGDAVEDALED